MGLLSNTTPTGPSRTGPAGPGGRREGLFGYAFTPMSDEPLDASTIFGPTAPARASTQLDHAADEIASMFGAEPDDAPIDEMKRTLPAPPLRAGPEGGQGGAEGEGRRRGMPTPELRERPAQGAAEVFTQRGIRMLLGKIERLERDLAEAVQDRKSVV